MAKKKRISYPKTSDALLGVAVGDAIGVPFEFKSRKEMELNPCTDITGFGTHNQAPGTWSDDASLTFCLAESLCNGFDLYDIAKQFVRWKRLAYWTPYNEVFDIGITTSKSINELESHLVNNSVSDYLAQKEYASEMTNGNGSLMRILPLVFHIKGMEIDEQFDIIWNVSALTHGHIRAAYCCLIYLRLAENLLAGMDKLSAYTKMREDVQQYWDKVSYRKDYQYLYENFIQNDVRYLTYSDLKSGGYVMESIEASLWCFMQTNSYEDAILKSVNLGSDTDTTAAITGGLAGLYYGAERIPEHWVSSLARLDDILDLGNRLDNF